MKMKLSLLTLVTLITASSINFNLDARRRNRDRVTELRDGRLEVCRKVGSDRGSRAGKGLLFGGLTGAALGGAAGGGRGAGIGFGVGALTGAAIGASSGNDDYDCYITTKEEYYGTNQAPRTNYRR